MAAMAGVWNRARRRLKQRFTFLRWPAEVMRDRVNATRNKDLFTRAAVSRDYPFRAVRYWWAYCAIMDESRRLARTLTIVDAGCGRGMMRKFVGNDVHNRWVGLDCTMDTACLTEIGYDELHACDFDKALPLPDHSADIVVFLHVKEHLPRPSFTVMELSRILRPGGVLLAGSPVAPRWVALLREWQLRKQVRQGVRELGQRVNSFWPARCRNLVRDAGLELDFLSGAFLLRWSGNPLENHRWWLRLNQLWGALFPSLGCELYFMARKAEPFVQLGINRECARLSISVPT